MPRTSILGLTAQPAPPASPEKPSLPDLLHIKAERGGESLLVRFNAITAWVDSGATVRGSDEWRGVTVHLSNGESTRLSFVGFDVLTDAMKSHYGDGFETAFAQEATGETKRCYARVAHIIGVTQRATMGATVHVVGQHALPRLQMPALGPVVVQEHLEPPPAPIEMSQPLQRFPVYSPDRTYNPNELVVYGGSLYRHETRSGNNGSPLQDVAGWTHIRTLEGPEPVRISPTEVQKASRKADVGEYSDSVQYGFGDLVRYKGKVYRKLTRPTSNGRPDRAPNDWDHVSAPETLGLAHA